MQHIVRLAPIANSGFIGILVVSIFLWKLLPLLSVVLVLMVAVYSIIQYAGNKLARQGSAFWMFIAREVLAFGTLFFCILSCDTIGMEGSISSFLEAPFVGCFLLLGSSITATAFHHNLGLACSYKWYYMTLLLGALFIILQIYEFRQAELDWSNSIYYSCCYSVVGLHCIHVFLGLLAFAYFSIFLKGAEGYLQYFYASLVVWYWHFVDYVWLFVYTIVYLC